MSCAWNPGKHDRRHPRGVYDHPRSERGRLLRHAFHDVGSDERDHSVMPAGIIRRMFSRKGDASQGCLVEIMMRTRHAAFGLDVEAEGTGISRPLSRQVNLLGMLLGQAIRQQAGQGTLDLVEELRMLCKQAVAEDDPAPRIQQRTALRSSTMRKFFGCFAPTPRFSIW